MRILNYRKKKKKRGKAEPSPAHAAYRSPAGCGARPGTGWALGIVSRRNQGHLLNSVVNDPKWFAVNDCAQLVYFKCRFKTGIPADVRAAVAGK